MLATFNSRFLKTSNWTDGRSRRAWDLSAIEESRLQELLDQKSLRTGAVQLAVEEPRIHPYLDPDLPRPAGTVKHTLDEWEG
jgi:hypothetical protein